MKWDRQFDVAVCFGALGHILPQEESRFVCRIADCLAVGGKFIFVTSTMPSKFSAAYWMARSFNAAMHVRNFLIRPHFIMYYLTFLWPDIRAKLEQAGFDVESYPTFQDGRESRLIKTVVATKTSSGSTNDLHRNH